MRNIKTYHIKIGMNQAIWITKHPDSQLQQFSVSFFIIFSVLRRQVLPSVELYYEFVTVNIKINNVIQNHFLTANGIWKCFQVLIPQFILFRCCCPP